MQHLLEKIIDKFQIQSKFISYQELNSGHINDTYLIKTQHKPHYVLQRINGNVFRKTEELITNKVLVSNFLQGKLSQLTQDEIFKKVLCFVQAKDTTFFYKDDKGNYWNTTVLIENSITYHTTGSFLEQTKEFDASELTNILPDFHSVSKRYLQLKEALKTTSKDKISNVKEHLDFIENHIDEMKTIDVAIENNQLELRLTHSDTKISNILFSESNKAICLIDTDTVMSGVLHFDYGDAIRTICNTADEDSKELETIDFNLEYFKSYSEGFLSELKNIPKHEYDILPLSIKMMPFIMGIRFLTDYLNGNIYYKTNYNAHNLDRAIAQFTLMKKINEKSPQINDFFSNYKKLKKSFVS
jgi:thiamine kinase-like enzyme